MQPTISLDRTLVAVKVDGLVHLMLELSAPDAVASQRAPIDAVVVLDRSGSMGGAPLHSVREATCRLLRLLGADDRLGVVVFDDEVRMILPLGRHDAERASAVVRKVRSGGSTNLSGGWLKGLEMLSADGRPDALKRIVVLTDGHANVGITGQDELASLSSRARGQGVTTSTIGFDDGYDEVLLAAIADAGGGNDYWCAGPDQSPQVFAAEFDGLASVVAQNISVEVRPPSSINVAVLNEYPITVVDGGMQIALGDAYGGEQRRIVVAYELPAPNEAGMLELGTLVVRWASMVGDVALATVTIPVSVQASDDPTVADVAPDPAVTEHVNVLRAAKDRKAAHERLADGDVAGAQAYLASAVDHLMAAPCAAADLDQTRLDLDELTAGAWSQASTKRMYSTTRSIQKGRRSRFDDQT